MTLYTELALYYNFAAPSIIFTIVIIATVQLVIRSLERTNYSPSLRICNAKY